jgi:hypothetical protein
MDLGASLLGFSYPFSKVVLHSKLDELTLLYHF